MNPVSLHLPNDRAATANADTHQNELDRTRVATAVRNRGRDDPSYPGPCEVDARPGKVAWLVGLDGRAEVVWFDFVDWRGAWEPGQVRRWRGTSGDTVIEMNWGPAGANPFDNGPVDITVCQGSTCALSRAERVLQITNSF